MTVLKKLCNSFANAFSGIWFCITKCRNFRIHTVAAMLVIYFSRFYDFTDAENCVIYIIIVLVLVLECINTAIEQLCDAVTKEYSPIIKKSKDVAAGAVLCVAICSVFIAIKLFFDLNVLNQILLYFSSPIKLAVLMIFIILAIIYIFYEDIFKNAKQ